MSELGAVAMRLLRSRCKVPLPARMGSIPVTSRCLLSIMHEVTFRSSIDVAIPTLPIGFAVL